MNFLCCILLALTVVFPANTQGKKSHPKVLPSDQLVLTEQFIRDFFPQFAARHATVELRASIGIGMEPRPGELNFEVIDLCVAPRTPAGPQVGNPVLLCTEYDKTYKRPLWGAIVFDNRNGRVVPIEGRLHGELFEGPDACRDRKPVDKEDFIKRMHVDRLSVFMGKRVKLTNIEKEPEDGQWKASIATGPLASLHSQYDFYLDRCGYITNFYMRN